MHYVLSETQIIPLLERGRIDFAIMDDLQGWALIEDEILQNYGVPPEYAISE